jgi:hypothetical protein
MALDKLVDSSQLDTDLTAVANAIRTKGGTSAQLAFPAGFVSAVDAIPTGGGGSPYVSAASMVVAAECNWYTAFTALDYKLKYQTSSVLLVAISGDVASSGVNYTNNNCIFTHNGRTVVSSTGTAWYFQQKSSKVAPSDFVFRFNRAVAEYYTGDNITINADGSFNSPTKSTGTVMLPAGTNVVLFEFPRILENGEIDLTPFGT